MKEKAHRWPPQDQYTALKAEISFIWHENIGCENSCAETLWGSEIAEDVAGELRG